MENEKVLISVIIPVYNAEEHLPQCLNSVLSQSLTELEVICVDDGSTDESPRILAEYAAQNGRVTVLTQKNRYAGAARNRGMDAARGKYIAFLDADDYFLPGSLAFMYCRAEEYRLDLIKCGFHYLNAKTGERYKTLYSTNSSTGRLRCGQVLSFARFPARLLNIPDVPWNGLYRRSFLEEHGIRFNHLRCVNDRSFFIDCLLHASRLMVHPRAVACYRVEQAGSLVGNKANHFENQLESYRIISSLCAAVSSPLKRQVLAQELNGAFSWYERLKIDGDSARLEAQLTDFLRDLDEADVGRSFLNSFSYSGDYFRLRYGTDAPARPNALKRAVRCWQEHGLAYTLERLAFREERKWNICSKKSKTS